MSVAVEVEIRCPVGPRRLFSKLRLAGERPVYTEDNLIEFACGDCRKALHDPSVTRVLHRFDFLGELVTTEVEHAPDRSEIT
jgi:hypothetical protein